RGDLGPPSREAAYRRAPEVAASDPRPSSAGTPGPAARNVDHAGLRHGAPAGALTHRARVWAGVDRTHPVPSNWPIQVLGGAAGAVRPGHWASDARDAKWDLPCSVRTSEGEEGGRRRPGEDAKPALQRRRSTERAEATLRSQPCVPVMQASDHGHRNDTAVVGAIHRPRLR